MIAYVHWDEIDPLLGTDTDQNIGDRVNVPGGTIAYRRNLLGIQRYSPKKVVNWGLIDDELGKTSDGEVARKHGCSTSSISTRRVSLGIQSYSKKRSTANPDFDWSKVDWSMGNRALERLFKDEGIGSRSKIITKRRAMGIAPNKAGQAVRVSNEMLQELGTVPDNKLARKYGVTDSTVNWWRNLLGIPLAIKPVRHDWSIADPYWGKATDSEISRITGIPRETIVAHRKSKGIPMHRKGRRTKSEKR